MSNLYKPWTIQQQPQSARVINSDAVAAELLEKITKQAKAAELPQEDGFTEGILQETAENVIKTETDVAYVQMAKEEAEEIRNAAKADAEAILVEAENQKAAIENKAAEDGFQKGQERAAQELETLKGNLESSYEKKQQELDETYRQKRADMEKDLVDVIVQVFNKVFHIQFDNKKEILLYLINNAILDIEGEKSFRIKVAEANVSFLENQKDEILDRVGHDIELDIVADFSMDGNDCVIETDSGVFNCSLGVQLENLIKDIRSLCS